MLDGENRVLGRFIVKYSDKCNPFFQTLKQNVEWPDEYEHVFQGIKMYLTMPLVLTSPSPGETIGMYVASSDITLNSVLFTKDEGKPIFFISKKLTRVEMKYKKHETLSLTLVHTVRRLKPYF